MTETKLGLFRHGQTDWNIDLRLQGTADIPMNQTGIDQVAKAADLIAEQDWEMIISSPLGRARHSAEIIASRLGVTEVQNEEKLLERAFGIGEGMLYSEWHEKYSKLDEIPGAESKASIEQRSRELLDHTLATFRNRKVLAVSHGALIRFVLSEVTDGAIPPQGERLENASLHVLRHTQSWELDSWAPRPLGA